VATPIDERERQELCDLFDELGPDAATLCVGWTTADLAAHLVLREHFHRWPDDRLATEKAKGMRSLVSRLRAGAPLIPWRVPGLRVMLNGTEYLIHHEDVRRANGRGRREDRPDLDDLAWRSTGFVGRRMARSIRPFSVEVRAPGKATKRFGSGPSVVLSGSPTELLLFLSGRRANAAVELTGNSEAVATIEKTDRGL
jgi:uncharacterized protein (TIGR03085 family)